MMRQYQQIVAKSEAVPQQAPRSEKRLPTMRTIIYQLILKLIYSNNKLVE